MKVAYFKSMSKLALFCSYNRVVHIFTKGDYVCAIYVPTTGDEDE